MATPKDKAGATNTNTKPGKMASEVLGAEMKTSKGEDIIIREDFSTEGFVTSESRKSDGGDPEWAKLYLDRTFYKADYCARIGGVRGYLVQIEQMKSLQAVNKDNPEGLFDAMIVRLTAACPVVSDKGVISRAETGQDVIVVLNHGIKKLKELDVDPDYTVEIELMPKEKIMLANKHELWKFEAAISRKPVKRADINPAAEIFALFAKFKEEQEAKQVAAAKEPTKGSLPAASAPAS